MTVTVIDYGSGNLRSVAKALEQAAAQAGLAEAIEVTGDAAAVRRADRIVLPGVGAFGDCKRGLEALPGMIEALEERVHIGDVPFLGICVGMQLLATVGHEHGDHLGLDWIGGSVVPLAPNEPQLVVPQMGWNRLILEDEDHPVLSGLHDAEMYFAHSYVFVPADPADSVAEVEYGGRHVAAIARANIFGVQFHPEKSQEAGLRLLSNFLRWTP
jgi:glutamine amidotransferase